jgi:uncharacterized membrane protein YfcA
VLDVAQVAALLVLGVFTGLVAGLLGVGGGMFMVPFLTVFFTAQGVAQALVIKMAVATSLATILLTSLSSMRAHHQRGAVLWPVARLLAPGILLGALAGAQLASRLDATWLAWAFALFLAFSATQMLRDHKPKATRELPRASGLFAAGATIGVLSGFVGGGGGFVSVPFMVWCNVPIHNAVATSAVLGLPIAIAGTIGYVLGGWNVPGLPAHSLGYVSLPAFVTVAIASVLTAPLGATIAHRARPRLLRRFFAVLLYALAAYMLTRAMKS